MGYPFDCAILRDFVPRLLFLTCSRPTEQVRRIGAVTCSWLIKRRLAYILCFIIRNRRFSFVVCFCFTNAEYLIALVDFIVALRRTKGRGRRTLRSPPSPSSGLHLIHPGVIRCGGVDVGCRGFGTILVAVFRCFRYSPVPNFVLLSVFGLRSFAFQSGCWAGIARFSLLVGEIVRACGYVWFGYGL